MGRLTPRIIALLALLLFIIPPLGVSGIDPLSKRRERLLNQWKFMDKLVTALEPFIKDETFISELRVRLDEFHSKILEAQTIQALSEIEYEMNDTVLIPLLEEFNNQVSPVYTQEVYRLRSTASALLTEGLEYVAYIGNKSLSEQERILLEDLLLTVNLTFSLDRLKNLTKEEILPALRDVLLLACRSLEGKYESLRKDLNDVLSEEERLKVLSRLDDAEKRYSDADFWIKVASSEKNINSSIEKLKKALNDLNYAIDKLEKEIPFVLLRSKAENYRKEVESVRNLLRNVYDKHRGLKEIEDKLTSLESTLVTIGDASSRIYHLVINKDVALLEYPSTNREIEDGMAKLKKIKMKILDIDKEAHSIKNKNRSLVALLITALGGISWAYMLLIDRRRYHDLRRALVKRKKKHIVLVIFIALAVLIWFLWNGVI